MLRGLHITGTPTQCLEQILMSVKEGPNHAFSLDLGQMTYSGNKKPRLFAISAGLWLDALICKKA